MGNNMKESLYFLGKTYECGKKPDCTFGLEGSTYMNVAALSSGTRCGECRHPLHLHVAFSNPELAKWLRLIHGQCANCVACADEW